MFYINNLNLDIIKKIILLFSVVFGVLGFTKTEGATKALKKESSMGDRNSKTIDCRYSGDDCFRLDTTIIIAPAD